MFQLAHCVEEAEFPLPAPKTGRIENAWAIHQVETTVDFARRSRVLSWLLGGLNFQIEHHLFPRICHVNYPAIAQVVETTCREFGVEYREFSSFRPAWWPISSGCDGWVDRTLFLTHRSMWPSTSRISAGREASIGWPGRRSWP